MSTRLLRSTELWRPRLLFTRLWGGAHGDSPAASLGTSALSLYCRTFCAYHSDNCYGIIPAILPNERPYSLD